MYLEMDRIYSCLSYFQQKTQICLVCKWFSSYDSIIKKTRADKHGDKLEVALKVTPTYSPLNLIKGRGFIQTTDLVKSLNEQTGSVVSFPNIMA